MSDLSTARIGVRLLGALAVVAFLSVSTQAAMIDFGADSGAPTKGWSILTNQFASSGVTFSTTDNEGVYWWGNDYSWRPARYSISAGSTWGSVPGCTDPIRMDFNPYVAQVSVRGFDGGGDTDQMLLKAYDRFGQLVDSKELTGTFEAPGSTLTVNGSQIAYVTVEAIATYSGLFFDDLNFTTVPEPASGLMSMFLCCLACRKLRRHPDR
jgi:hypothetical protein